MYNLQIRDTKTNKIIVSNIKVEKTIEAIKKYDLASGNNFHLKLEESKN